MLINLNPNPHIWGLYHSITLSPSTFTGATNLYSTPWKDTFVLSEQFRLLSFGSLRLLISKSNTHGPPHNTLPNKAVPVSRAVDIHYIKNKHSYR